MKPLQDYTLREKELLQRLEKLTREHGRQLEERDREWQEKVTSLQNNMQAAQGNKPYSNSINTMKV